MNLFRRNPGNATLSDALPEGTFRCDACQFVQPTVLLAGRVEDAADNPPRTYTLCGTCALWLGMGTTHFPQGVVFGFSDKQRDKIKALRGEMEAVGGFEKIMRQVDALPVENIKQDVNGSIERMHDFLDKMPLVKSLIKFRFSSLPAAYLELSARLTRGEPVKASEIKKANK
jgi:hypothetical protein